MGGYYSIDNTNFGKSILHNTYKTTKPVTLEFHSGNYNIETCFNKPITIPKSPNSNETKDSIVNNHFSITIPPGLIFVIIHIMEKKSFKSSTLKIYCNILNDMELPQNMPAHTVATEVDNTYDYGFANIKKSTNTELLSLLDKQRSKLKLKNIICSINSNDFFTQTDREFFSFDYNKSAITKPIIYFVGRFYID